MPLLSAVILTKAFDRVTLKMVYEASEFTKTINRIGICNKNGI